MDIRKPGLRKVGRRFSGGRKCDILSSSQRQLPEVSAMIKAKNHPVSEKARNGKSL
jgi:hypothetical protein